MAFVDEVTIEAYAGSGGNGVVRWLRTKETARGGPCGGDGGRGGDVLLVGVRDLAALARYRSEKSFHAENGEAGRTRLEHGKDGNSLELPVPLGTVAKLPNGEVFEVLAEGEQVQVFKGGGGGYGNAHFKSSTNQNPFQKTDGKRGQGGDIHLTLKLIADVGLIGLPNAGKSSLLNALTRAKSKVGSYPFTTLDPHLGEFHGSILADIPGLIEGASKGRGLGTRFLRHIERTGFMLHLVSSEQEQPLKAYNEVRRELETFSPLLKEKREVVVLSKTDLLSPAALQARLTELKKGTGREVVGLSVASPEGVVEAARLLSQKLVETTH